MKRLLLINWMILSLFCAWGQNRKIDSLNNELTKGKSDSAIINLLNQKANDYISIDIDSSINITQKVIQKASEIHYLSGLANAYQVAGSAYTFKSSFKAAIEHYKRAEQLYKQLADSSGLNKLNRGYGIYYGMQSKYDSALIFFKKNVDYLERKDDKKELSSAYQNLAVSYTMQSNYNKALFYQKKAMELAESLNDTATMAFIACSFLANS